ncbi:MAG: hypothetical protein U1E97_06545 [Alphaproteobacteria bacterium]
MPAQRPTIAAILLLTAALGGCSYRGETGNPVATSLTYFSYLAADDIRAMCGPGAATRYRIVYNGIYEEQVRRYDIVGDLQGGGILTAHASVPSNLTEIRSNDLFAPWRDRQGTATLDRAGMEGLRAALEQSGAFGPAPSGALLRSQEYYWVTHACVDGRYHFNAFIFPSARFAALTFPDVLLRQDQTGVPFKKAVRPGEDPNSVTSYPPYGLRDTQEQVRGEFVLRVGDNRLRRGLFD